MFPQISLTTDVSRDDVARMRDWLRDPEVSGLWYGNDDTDGHALHIGYSPEQIQGASDEEWDQVFNQDERRIYAIYATDEAHIGEGQLLVEWPLEEGATVHHDRAQGSVAPPLRNRRPDFHAG